MLNNNKLANSRERERGKNSQKLKSRLTKCVKNVGFSIQTCFTSGFYAMSHLRSFAKLKLCDKQEQEH